MVLSLENAPEGLCPPDIGTMSGGSLRVQFGGSPGGASGELDARRQCELASAIHPSIGRAPYAPGSW